MRHTEGMRPFCGQDAAFGYKPKGLEGYKKQQSWLRLFVVFCSATFFCARKNVTHFSSSRGEPSPCWLG
jgi:hypothetical protein